MDILKSDPEQVVIPPTPIETDMTLEEFLESGLEGYEYVNEDKHHCSDRDFTFYL